MAQRSARESHKLQVGGSPQPIGAGPSPTRYAHILLVWRLWGRDSLCKAFGPAAPFTTIWVTPSLETERACKACAFARARFDSAVTHHLKCGRGLLAGPWSATPVMWVRFPPSAPSCLGSSAVERHVEGVRVGGSIPSSGTISSGTFRDYSGIAQGSARLFCNQAGSVGIRLSPPFHSRRAISVRALRC